MATRLQRLRREGLGEPFAFAGPGFRRAAPWLMALVVLAGLLVRLWPAVRFAVWGSDEGEYIKLTEQLVRTGHISFDYSGWGVAYPYFQGLFVVSAAVHDVIGIDVFHAVLWTTPILAATIGPLVGFLAYRVTSDPRVGLVAGAFAAVTAAIAITTSHAMPGALGQVLLLAMLALLPDTYRDRNRGLVVLGVLALALLWTHHLTTYFAIGILACIPFWRELTQRHTDTLRLRVELPLLGGLLVGAAIWWLGVAVGFREQIVGDELKLNPFLTTFLFLVPLAALPALVVLKRRRSKWFVGPHYPAFPRQRYMALVGFVGITGVVALLVLVKLPGTNIKLPWLTFWYALAVTVFVAFMPLGASVIRFYRQGTLIQGWLLAILASLVFAIVTNSHVLFPFRHIDYLAEAMAPLIAIGMVMAYDEMMASRVPAERPRVRANLVALLIVMLLAAGIMSNPPRQVLGGFEEGIGDNELEAVRWLAAHPAIVPPGSTIAADHRVSSLLWGLADLRATWDYTPRTYHAENASDALAELRDLRIPGNPHARIDYVLLSPQIEQGVTLLQWENSAPMTPQAIQKFDDPAHFERVYPPPGVESDVRVYRVLWNATS